jgi:type VI secretion system protein ImpA
MPLNIDELLTELAPDHPCGEDLEYDAAYIELERQSQEVPEQQLGDRVEPARPPNWKDVRRIALELLGRTRDLRVQLVLTQSLLQTEGLPGLRDGLSLLRQTVDRYWDSMHPRLDPDDGNDPTQRVNILMGLCDLEGMLRPLQATPIAESRSLGRFNLRDYQIATGKLEVKAEAGTTPPTLAAIQGAFSEMDAEALDDLRQAVSDGVDHLIALEAGVTGQVGASRAPNFEPLRNPLREILGILQEQVARRGVGDGPEESRGTDGGAQGEPGVAGKGATGASAVNSRQDVVRVLDLICEYYAKHEPSSPLPLLLKRAKRLVPMTFMEIMQDLAPSGVPQIEVLRGQEPQ